MCLGFVPSGEDTSATLLTLFADIIWVLIAGLSEQGWKAAIVVIVCETSEQLNVAKEAVGFMGFRIIIVLLVETPWPRVLHFAYG